MTEEKEEKVSVATGLELHEFALGDVETIMEQLRDTLQESCAIQFDFVSIQNTHVGLQNSETGNNIFTVLGSKLAQCSLSQSKLDARIHALRALEKFLKHDLFHQLCITDYYDDAAKKEVPMTMWSHWDDIGKNDTSREMAFEIEAGKWFPRHLYWTIRSNRRIAEDRKTEIVGIRYAIQAIFDAEERRQRYEEYREQKLSLRY